MGVSQAAELLKGESKNVKMVFESVVVELLNRYLKPYVKKLDTSQLKVGVWKGIE